MVLLNGRVFHCCFLKGLNFRRNVWNYNGTNQKTANKNADGEGAVRFTAVGVLCWSLRHPVGERSVGQSLSALCASSLEDVSAVSSLHSLSEAMLLFSLTLFRLVSSQHRMHLLYSESEAFHLQWNTLLHNDRLHYNRFSTVCQEFFNIFHFFYSFL